MRWSRTSCTISIFIKRNRTEKKEEPCHLHSESAKFTVCGVRLLALLMMAKRNAFWPRFKSQIAQIFQPKMHNVWIFGALHAWWFWWWSMKLYGFWGNATAIVSHSLGIKSNDRYSLFSMFLSGYAVRMYCIYMSLIWYSNRKWWWQQQHSNNDNRSHKTRKNHHEWNAFLGSFFSPHKFSLRICAAC